MAVPTITEALADTVSRALSLTEDKLLRIEDIHGVDVDEFMALLDKEQTIRFGLITPNQKLHVRRRLRLSRDPRTITKWRNEAVASRRKSPVIIVGTASGRDEAGLKKVPFVIKHHAILDALRYSIVRYLEATVPSKNPGAFCSALLGMARENLIDAFELNAFFGETLANPQKAVSEPQKKLWKLRLVPDIRAMDEGSPGTRLAKNYQTVELLRNQPDTIIEEKQLERLEQAAEAGNRMAVMALKFRGSGRKEDLKELELDALLGQMASRGGGSRRPSRKTIGLMDALDSKLIEKGHLATLAEEWPLDAENVSLEIDLGDVALRVVAKANTKSYSILDDGKQILATERLVGTAIDDGQCAYIDDLLQAAKNADVLRGRKVYEDLVSTLAASRASLAPLFRWEEDLFTVLICNATMQTAAADYLRAWETLADEVLKEQDNAAVSALVKFLAMLDGHWIRADLDAETVEFQEVRLFAIHPFVLRPLVELAQYTCERMGEDNLGTRVMWAHDRVLPAYPAIWRGNQVFVHVDGTTTPSYAVRARRSLPSVSTPKGIVDIVRSFVGLNPYAARHLSLLLVDPPGGGGVSRAIDECVRQELVQDITVYVAHTDRRDTEFPSSESNVEYIGAFGTGDDWATRSNIFVHIAIAFRRARDAETGSHTGATEPSRGLHNSLTATLEPPDSSSGGPANSWVPKVVVQPRDSNDVVRKYMLLARQSYGPDRLYRISPMLPEKESSSIEALALIAEWIVVATPSPIGLVPPRTFPGRSLTYLGREDFGPYGLFCYGKDLFGIRKKFEGLLSDSPIASSAEHLEAEIQRLSLTVPNGILRIGRAEGQVTVQIGVMAASYFARDSIT